MAFQQDVIPFSHRFQYNTIEDLAEGGCHLNIYSPPGSGNSKALAIMIRGGGWVSGTAEAIPFNQVRYLNGKGVVVASLEYRLLPHAGIKESRQDCLDAYRYIQTKLNQDLQGAGAGIQIDGKRVSAIGWSAGGCLALFLGADVAKDPSLPPLKAVKVGYPISDFSYSKGTLEDFEKALDSKPEMREKYAALQKEGVVSSFARGPPGPGTAPPSPFPTSPDGLPPRLAYLVLVIPSHLFPSQLLRSSPPFPDDASPIGVLSSSSPPTYVMIAGGDRIIPISQSTDLATKLKSLGIECEMREARDMGHAVAECLKVFPPWEKELGQEWWDDAVRPGLDFVLSHMVYVG